MPFHDGQDDGPEKDHKKCGKNENKKRKHQLERRHGRALFGFKSAALAEGLRLSPKDRGEARSEFDALDNSPRGFPHIAVRNARTEISERIDSGCPRTDL